MQVIKPDINIDFVGKRRIAYVVSAVMIVISIVSLIARGGPRYGIDFAGGTLIQVKFQGNVEINKIKDGLAAADMAGASIQHFGEAALNEYLLRTEGSVETRGEFADTLQKSLSEATGTGAEVRRVEMVGPQVGQDLREKALLAIFFSLLFIAIYISGRFEFKWLISGVMAAALAGAVYFLSLFHVGIPVLIVVALIVTLALFYFLDLKYAMGAIVALIHDVTITVGLFSIFDKEFSLPIIAALLTIIGYSLNDTIIVYDRIRENLKRYHKNPLAIVINRSVNDTLSRTILTAGTTLLTVVALFALGGGIIHDFAFAMLVGVVVGTYSSVYIASPVLLAWQKKR